VVAVSGRLAAALLSFRRRRLGRDLLLLLVSGGAAAGAAFGAEALAGAGREVAVGEGFLLGILLAAGSFLRPRPLEQGWGVIARGPRGGLSVAGSIRGTVLAPSTLFRRALEDATYGVLSGRPDPACELASWILLTLSAPHGPAEGEWASLGGALGAGYYSYPEDLAAALGALGAEGFVEVDPHAYPGRARLTGRGRAFVEGGDS
jgi:hypothetical protein